MNMKRQDQLVFVQFVDRKVSECRDRVTFVVLQLSK